MLYRIAGRAGSGKTEYIKSLLGEKCLEGAPCVVIVPVQQSMEYEKDVFTRFGSRANLYIEVLTFDRLPNRTYREYGNLASTAVDDGGRALLMARALRNVREKLSEFAAVSGENAFVNKMLDTSRALKENNISHALFGNIEGGGGMAVKARDVHTILAEYDSFFGKDKTDERDMLGIYAENLKTMDFFRGKTVFVDSFYSFTEQQHRVMDEIASQCEDIYITFCLDPEDETLTFATPAAAYNRVGRRKITKDIFLDGNKRKKNHSLAYAEANLWNNTAPPFYGEAAVEFISCANRFEETEAVSSVVAGLIRQGFRYRDIAVILRSPESYAGIIDAVLEKHGIPCFFSVKDSLMTKPLTVFLLSAVEAVASNYSLPVILKFIKSGFLPIGTKRANLLVRYAETWRIRGKAWVSESDWLMNPGGYREVMSDYESAVLKEVNAARAEVSQLIGELASELNSELTGGTAAKALYKLLENVDASESVRQKAKKLRESGDEAAAQKLAELWDVIISSLDQLFLVCGDEKLEPIGLLKRLELLLSSYSVGSVPVSCDSVVIGNAALFRGDGQRAVILLGVNDGVFPANPSTDGIFDARELSELERHGICLEDGFEKQLDNERLFFYTAVATPSEKLFCIYTEGESGRPSIGALRLTGLFPGALMSKLGENVEKTVFSPASARENARYAGEAAKMLLREKGLDDGETINTHPLSDKSALINNKNRSFVSLSPTGLEKYTYCGFSYFGRYVLNLAENKKADFAQAEIGTFVHKVLEIFLSSRVNGEVFSMPSEKEIAESVEELTENYIRSVCGDFGGRSQRFRYIFTRLKTTLKLLLKNICEELASGLFVPEGFEVRPNGGYVEYTAENGLKINLSGKIDRIDTFKKAGKTYVRVVDYKTGGKVFDRRALENGLDLQMFLYLFAYCSGIKDAVPAGVNYLPAKLESRRDELCTDEDLTPITDKAFRRSGLILCDREVVEAMEAGTVKRFLPVTVNKDGSLGASRSLVGLEEFGLLKEKTENYIKKIAAMIAGGVMDVSPLKLDENYDACRYCGMKEVCRLSTDRSVVRRRGFFNVKGGDVDGE